MFYFSRKWKPCVGISYEKATHFMTGGHAYIDLSDSWMKFDIFNLIIVILAPSSRKFENKNRNVIIGLIWKTIAGNLTVSI